MIVNPECAPVRGLSSPLSSASVSVHLCGASLISVPNNVSVHL